MTESGADREVYGGAPVLAEPQSVLLAGHDVPLGRYTTVRRLLPQRTRRMVGAWCFVDAFGPDDVGGRPGMQIPPHPHTGLQIGTWLVEGEILHRDSLGNAQTLAAGQLNLMTSGHGIAHSEQSPPDHPPRMHGVQLWAATPDPARHGRPGFAHHADLPEVAGGGLAATVVVGGFGGVRSPAELASPLLAVELRLAGPGEHELPLETGFEHGVLALSGAAEVAGVPITPGSLLYLGAGRATVTVTATGPARLFLLGGEPFDEPLVMWWNFVARSHEEIAEARADWMAGDGRFGTVADCEHDALPAPPMPTVRLKARDRNGLIIP